jgi:hypothetical protein
MTFWLQSHVQRSFLKLNNWHQLKITFNLATSVWMPKKNKTILCFFAKHNINGLQRIEIGFSHFKYSARRLIGSRFIESAAYCNQKLLALLYNNSTQKTLVNWIIRLLLSLLCRPKVILCGGHCISIFYFS